MCLVSHKIASLAGLSLVVIFASVSFAPAEPGCPCALAVAEVKPDQKGTKPREQLAAPAEQSGGKQAVSEEVKPREVLRVWADPDNLPFSNRHMEGFENK